MRRVTTHRDANAEAAHLASTISIDELNVDPYPLYATLRAAGGLHYVPAVDLWLATRWDDVEAVSKQPDAFTAEVASSPVDRCFGSPTIITSDGDVHRDLRRGIDPAYRPARVNSTIGDLVRPLATELLDELVPRGEGELMADYFEPISTVALARSLGFDDVDMATLRRWFRGLSDGATNFERDPAKQEHGDTTAAAIRACAHAKLDVLEVTPDDSALSNLVHAGVAGGGLRPREAILPTVLVALLGGMQEPGHGAGSVTVGLLDHPDQLALAASDPATWVGPAVDEGLRWVAPIGTQTRQATAEITMSGTTVPAGAAVAAVVASAARDETRFNRPGESSPAEFDMHRPAFDQPIFGFGPHYCTGHWFARQQIRIALEELLTRCPNLRYADDAPRPQFFGWEFRAPTAVHVRWT